MDQNNTLLVIQDAADADNQASLAALFMQCKGKGQTGSPRALLGISARRADLRWPSLLVLDAKKRFRFEHEEVRGTMGRIQRKNNPWEDREDKEGVELDSLLMAWDSARRHYFTLAQQLQLSKYAEMEEEKEGREQQPSSFYRPVALLLQQFPFSILGVHEKAELSHHLHVKEFLFDRADLLNSEDDNDGLDKKKKEKQNKKLGDLLTTAQYDSLRTFVDGRPFVSFGVEDMYDIDAELESSVRKGEGGASALTMRRNRARLLILAGLKLWLQLAEDSNSRSNVRSRKACEEEHGMFAEPLTLLAIGEACHRTHAITTECKRVLSALSAVFSGCETQFQDGLKEVTDLMVLAPMPAFHVLAPKLTACRRVWAEAFTWDGLCEKKGAEVYRFQARPPGLLPNQFNVGQDISGVHAFLQFACEEAKNGKKRECRYLTTEIFSFSSDLLAKTGAEGDEKKGAPGTEICDDDKSEDEDCNGSLLSGDLVVAGVRAKAVWKEYLTPLERTYMLYCHAKGKSFLKAGEDEEVRSGDDDNVNTACKDNASNSTLNDRKRKLRDTRKQAHGNVLIFDPLVVCEYLRYVDNQPSLLHYEHAAIRCFKDQQDGDLFVVTNQNTRSSSDRQPVIAQEVQIVQPRALVAVGWKLGGGRSYANWLHRAFTGNKQYDQELTSEKKEERLKEKL